MHSALRFALGISPPARPDADFRGNPKQLLAFLVHHGKQKGEQALAHWHDLPCIAPLPLEYCCGLSEYCHRQL